MEVKMIKTSDELKALYDVSALTWEGMILEEENLEAIINWLNQHDAIEDLVFHITTGSQMNEICSLEGDNAYYDDTTILSVTGIDNLKIMNSREDVGARWMDNIIDNNAWREGYHPFRDLSEE